MIFIRLLILLILFLMKIPLHLIIWFLDFYWKSKEPNIISPLKSIYLYFNVYSWDFSYVIKKLKRKDVKIYKNSFDNDHISLDEEELNYSGNSSFLQNIEENNLNLKKINFLKHKLCLLQKHLTNCIDTFEHFIMDNVIFSLKTIKLILSK